MLCLNALRRNWAAVVALGAIVLVQRTLAQQTPGQQTSGQQTPGQPPTDPRSNGGGNSTSGSNGAMPTTGTGSNNSGMPRGQSGGGTRGQGRAVEGAVSGRVVLSDGVEPDGRVAVQRVCGLTVTGEAYTDSSGHFTIQRPASGGTDSSARTNDSALWGCELRASLAGYRADPLPLANGHSSDSNDAVIIVLRRVGAAQALTVSATSLLAPREARKSYDKGMDAIRHNQPDEAQKDFSSAVQRYPRFAAAWLELGKVYEQRGHLAQARNAYGSAIAADAGFLFPYERLYQLDVRESKWEEAAQASGKVLRLDPYEFPEAFYFNAVANLELHDLDAAERSAREAVKLEGAQAEPRGNYVLAVILWRRGDLDGAAEKMQAFLSGPSSGPEWNTAQRMLAEIEKQIARRQARADN